MSAMHVTPKDYRLLLSTTFLVMRLNPGKWTTSTQRRRRRGPATRQAGT